MIERKPWIFPAGVKHVITDEMRAEREEITQHNNKIEQEFHERLNDWREAWRKKRVELLQSFGLTEEDATFSYPESKEYEITEILVDELE